MPLRWASIAPIDSLAQLFEIMSPRSQRSTPRAHETEYCYNSNNSSFFFFLAYLHETQLMTERGISEEDLISSSDQTFESEPAVLPGIEVPKTEIKTGMTEIKWVPYLPKM